jgi:hypothetical protein
MVIEIADEEWIEMQRAVLMETGRRPCGSSRESSAGSSNNDGSG